jgi:hypothetical protein
MEKPDKSTVLSGASSAQPCGTKKGECRAFIFDENREKRSLHCEESQLFFIGRNRGMTIARRSISPQSECVLFAILNPEILFFYSDVLRLSL